jgi:hypothetical protein
MNAERSEKLAEAIDVTNDFDGEIRELIRTRDVTFLRGPGKNGGDLNNLNSLIQRVAGGSTGEIDGLIMQLQDMRDFLRDEADRIQDEIANYAKASQLAREHVEMLADRVSQWRTGFEAPPTAAAQE